LERLKVFFDVFTVEGASLFYGGPFTRPISVSNYRALCGFDRPICFMMCF